MLSGDTRLQFAASLLRQPSRLVAYEMHTGHGSRQTTKRAMSGWKKKSAFLAVHGRGILVGGEFAPFAPIEDSLPLPLIAIRDEEGHKRLRVSYAAIASYFAVLPQTHRFEPASRPLNPAGSRLNKPLVSIEKDFVERQREERKEKKKPSSWPLFCHQHQ